ncbi:MAG: hypothetical protein IPJ69_12140 [Deltaproteobacteria bacterium]|nr:MAG: hypothetical protein IPJ69_12140 [Deltaproteobacteria bacterium]
MKLVGSFSQSLALSLAIGATSGAMLAVYEHKQKMHEDFQGFALGSGVLSLLLLGRSLNRHHSNIWHSYRKTLPPLNKMGIAIGMATCAGVASSQLIPWVFGDTTDSVEKLERRAWLGLAINLVTNFVVVPVYGMLASAALALTDSEEQAYQLERAKNISRAMEMGNTAFFSFLALKLGGRELGLGSIFESLAMAFSIAFPMQRTSEFFARQGDVIRGQALRTFGVRFPGLLTTQALTYLAPHSSFALVAHLLGIAVVNGLSYAAVPYGARFLKKISFTK